MCIIILKNEKGKTADVYLKIPLNVLPLRGTVYSKKSTVYFFYVIFANRVRKKFYNTPGFRAEAVWIYFQILNRWEGNPRSSVADFSFNLSFAVHVNFAFQSKFCNTFNPSLHFEKRSFSIQVSQCTNFLFQSKLCNTHIFSVSIQLLKCTNFLFQSKLRFHRFLYI